MNIYGIGIRNFFGEDYIIPMHLQEIDRLFINNTKEEILNKIKSNDSTVLEEDANLLSIYKKIGTKWRADLVPVIIDPRVFTFSYYDLFNTLPKDKLLNIMYNHFRHFLTKNISDNFKSIIQMMNTKEGLFPNILDTLEYDEDRLVRVFLYTHLDLVTLLHLNDSVETLRISKADKIELKKVS